MSVMVASLVVLCAVLYAYSATPSPTTAGVVLLAFVLGLIAHRVWGSTRPHPMEALAAARSTKRARAKDYPPTFPNGWYLSPYLYYGRWC